MNAGNRKGVSLRHLSCSLRFKIIRAAIYSRQHIAQLRVFDDLGATINEKVMEVSVPLLGTHSATDLPHDILCLVFDKLDCLSVHRCSAVNSQWREVGLNPQVDRLRHVCFSESF
jgi:hypothetical protein